MRSGAVPESPLPARIRGREAGILYKHELRELHKTGRCTAFNAVIKLPGTLNWIDRDMGAMRAKETARGPLQSLTAALAHPCDGTRRNRP